MSHLDNSNLQHERNIVEINKTAGDRYVSRAIVVDDEPSSQDRVRAEAFGELFGAGVVFSKNFMVLSLNTPN